MSWANALALVDDDSSLEVVVTSDGWSGGGLPVFEVEITEFASSGTLDGQCSALTREARAS